jgi:hypothetical protein
MTFVPTGKIQKVINDVRDFNVQDDSTITLQRNTVYIAGSPISTSKRFIVEPNVSITGLTYAPSAMWSYTGSGTMFTGEDFNSFEHRYHSISCPSAQAYDFSSSNPREGLFQLDNVTLRSPTSSTLSCDKFGTFDNLRSFLVTNSSCSLNVDGSSGLGANDGITISGTSNILSISQFAIILNDATSIGLDFREALFNVFEVANFAFISTQSGSRAIVGDENSVNIAKGSIGSIRDCEFIGAIDPLNGITSKDIRVSSSSSSPVPDSTIAARLSFEGNALTTTMTAANTPTPINALWTDGEVEERMCFGDKLTFDNSTNTCTTQDGAIDVNGGSAFTSGLSNGDAVTLRENGGLPVELAEDTIYYIGSVTATTFQLYPDDTLTTPVNFTDNGTGINYYCHEQGNSSSGWMIYLGEVTTDISDDGWVSIQKSGGGSVGVRTVIMQTDTSYNVTRRQNGAATDASNTILTSSKISDIKRTAPGEGILIYVENLTGTIDNECTDALISISKA